MLNKNSIYNVFINNLYIRAQNVVKRRIQELIIHSAVMQELPATGVYYHIHMDKSYSTDGISIDRLAEFKINSMTIDLHESDVVAFELAHDMADSLDREIMGLKNILKDVINNCENWADMKMVLPMEAKEVLIMPATTHKPTQRAFNFMHEPAYETKMKALSDLIKARHVENLLLNTI